ncbi:MAG: BON domain-containing protein [Anaerolineae bacterium]|nr:BON domain-containing protein [Anaerolineae bacterium]
MADQHDNWDDYDDRPPFGRGRGRGPGHGRGRGRRRGRAWRERGPMRSDYGWQQDFPEDDDERDVYAREETISYRGTRTPYYSWPLLQTGPHTGKGPKGYRRSDDSIFEDACGRLTDAGWLDASDVEVRVENGEVSLEGTVSDRRAKRLAEDLVSGVRGVWDVHNRLRIPRADVDNVPETG